MDDRPNLTRKSEVLVNSHLMTWLLGTQSEV